MSDINYDDIMSILRQRDILPNLFDLSRIVEPESGKLVELNCGALQETKVSCNDVFGSDARCRNCTSLRAHYSNETVVKLEYAGGAVLLILSIPVEIQGRLLVDTNTASREIRDQIKLSLGWERAFFGDYKTSVTAFYNGRNGLPYTWIVNGDPNGDGNWTDLRFSVTLSIEGHVIPEPSTLIMLFGGAAICALPILKRRQAPTSGSSVRSARGGPRIHNRRIADGAIPGFKRNRYGLLPRRRTATPIPPRARRSVDGSGTALAVIRLV